MKNKQLTDIFFKGDDSGKKNYDHKNCLIVICSFNLMLMLVARLFGGVLETAAYFIGLATFLEIAAYALFLITRSFETRVMLLIVIMTIVVFAFGGWQRLSSSSYPDINGIKKNPQPIAVDRKY